jgi:hypothetical protein
MARFLPEPRQLLLAKRFLKTLFAALSNPESEFGLLKLPHESASLLVLGLQMDNLFADFDRQDLHLPPSSKFDFFSQVLGNPDGETIAPFCDISNHDSNCSIAIE